MSANNKLAFTGERFTPETGGQIKLEHMHRYVIAKELVVGKCVLDIASGEGYGSFILSSVAKHVIGVDIAKYVVQHAKSKYKRKNLEYMIGSCEEIPLDDNSIDIVVSFETIEHHNQHDKMLLEIRRILRPDGLLIISSPNKYEYSDIPNYTNPFHVKELYREELTALLNKYFSNIVIFSQQVAYGSIILNNHCDTSLVTYSSELDPSAVESKQMRSKYDIAIASNENIPLIRNSMYEGNIENIDAKKNEHIKKLQKTINSLITDRDAKAEAIDQLQNNLAAIIAESKTHIDKLGSSLDAVIADRDAKAEAIDQLQNNLAAITAESKTHIDKLGSSLDAVIADRDAKAEAIDQLQNNLATITAESKTHIDKLGSSLDAVIADRDAKAEAIDQLQNNLATITAKNKTHIDKLGSSLDAIIADREAIGQLQNNLKAIYNSKIWRATKPLRWFSGMFNLLVSKPDDSLDNTASKLVMIPDADNDISLPNDIEINLSHHRILLVSFYCPTRAHAGGLRILDLYDFIHKNYPLVEIDIYTHHRPDIDWKINDIYDIFDNVYLSSSEDLSPKGLELLIGKKLSYDVVDLQFHQCGYNIDSYREIGGKVIYTPMESLAKSFYLDVRTKSVIKNLFLLSNTARSLHYAAEELTFLPKVDEVICVSKTDAAFLKSITSCRNIRGLDTCISGFEFASSLSPEFVTTPSSERDISILYIAYFGSETNINALHWYLDKVHPIIKEDIPGYKITIVGRGDLSSFKNRVDSSIDIIGEVDSLPPYIINSRVCIAPALGGAGFRGKINQYSVMGLPTVASPISIRGLSYKHGKNIFVAERYSDFAEYCILLLNDTELNDKMGSAARELCLSQYTWQSKSKIIRNIYNLGVLDE